MGVCNNLDIFFHTHAYGIVNGHTHIIVANDIFIMEVSFIAQAYKLFELFYSYDGVTWDVSISDKLTI